MFLVWYVRSVQPGVRTEVGCLLSFRIFHPFVPPQATADAWVSIFEKYFHNRGPVLTEEVVQEVVRDPVCPRIFLRCCSRDPIMISLSSQTTVNEFSLRIISIFCVAGRGRINVASVPLSYDHRRGNRRQRYSRQEGFQTNRYISWIRLRIVAI